ncbi:MAG: TerB family tellurite resistance protein [bacterium]
MGSATGGDKGEAATRATDSAASPDRRRAMLSFAWAVALADGREDPGELALYDRLADNLGVDPEQALSLRASVTARYHEALRAMRASDAGGEAGTTAALAALISSGLEEYLVSATGVIGLSMLLGVPISLQGTASVTSLPRGVTDATVAGTPGLVVGTLLLRGLRERPALQKSLAMILACLDRRAE